LLWCRRKQGRFSDKDAKAWDDKGEQKVLKSGKKEKKPAKVVVF
jgi:hypothetical protein